MNGCGSNQLLVHHRWRYSSGFSGRLVAARKGRVLLFLLLHGPLGITMHLFPAVATLHAVLTLTVGIWLALSGRRLDRVAYVGAYIVGSEVLWRMAGAGVFYEFGKYATAAIFVVAMLRRGRIRSAILPAVYFSLLLPSSVLTVEGLDWQRARQLLSFNLSGPFALTVCVWFFSELKLSDRQVKLLFLTVIGPAIGIASITVYAILTASTIFFGRTSNRLTSGGFGPNQVSAILGLGALLAFMLYLFSTKAGRGSRALMIGAMVVFAVQSALTFSRGGLYLAIATAALTSFYLLRDMHSRAKIVAVTSLLFVAANFILLPRLDEFTGGALSSRFQNTDPTGRDEIFRADLQIWAEHSLFGVGPGMAKSYRARMFVRGKAHTEFSRLLAEHGIFGLASLLLLVSMGAQSFLRASSVKWKAVVICMVAWSFLFMLIYAMRLVAPAFMFGVAFAHLSRGEGFLHRHAKWHVGVQR